MNNLLEFQRKVGAIAKDSTNPFFKSNYFDINSLLKEVKPLLSELGLIINQPLTNINGHPALETRITDSITGETIESSVFPLPDIQDPQKMGSAITYYRRYAIQSLLALQSEDDDANVASNKSTSQPTKSNW